MSLPSRTRFRDPCPLYFLALSFLSPPRYMCLGFSFLSLHSMSFNSRTRFRDPCPLYFLALYFPAAPRFAPWHLLAYVCFVLQDAILVLLYVLALYFLHLLVAPRFMRHGLASALLFVLYFPVLSCLLLHLPFVCVRLYLVAALRICLRACILISVVCFFTCLRLSIYRGATPCLVSRPLHLRSQYRISYLTSCLRSCLLVRYDDRGMISYLVWSSSVLPSRCGFAHRVLPLDLPLY